MPMRLALLAVLLACAFLAPASSGQPGTGAPTMRLHFVDVGQGAATLIEFPCAAMLVDTGGEKNSEIDGTADLMEYLDSFFRRRTDLKQTLHSLVLTHPHVDHTRGVPAVLGAYRVLNAVTNGQETGSGRVGQKALHDAVAAAEETATGDDDISFNAVWLKDIPKNKGLTNNIIDPVKCDSVDPEITALWGSIKTRPAKWTAKHFENMNNHSVTMRIDFGKASFLVSGDLEESAMPDLVAHYRGSALLNIDVYQVGHHGSHNGTSHQLLNAMTPAIAVIPMGPPDRELSWTAWAYGHARKATVDLLLTHVSMTRPRKSIELATAVKTFTTVAIERAVYGTGWDGTVVLEADINGRWKAIVSETEPGMLVNVNKASAVELTVLPMIGAARAAAIVRHRTDNGPFTSIDDLRRVPGIGPNTMNAIRNLVTTGI